MKSYEELKQGILAGEYVAPWLKKAIAELDSRSAGDAMHDAGILAQVCKLRLQEVMDAVRK